MHAECCTDGHGFDSTNYPYSLDALCTCDKSSWKGEAAAIYKASLSWASFAFFQLFLFLLFSKVDRFQVEALRALKNTEESKDPFIPRGCCTRSRSAHHWTQTLRCGRPSPLQRRGTSVDLRVELLREGGACERHDDGRRNLLRRCVTLLLNLRCSPLARDNG